VIRYRFIHSETLTDFGVQLLDFLLLTLRPGFAGKCACHAAKDQLLPT
jgi:hypothetical protein